jgi:quinol-cytochrome oxidoreductase complex cytochrome b subunit
MYRQFMMAKTRCYFNLNKHRRSFHPEYSIGPAHIAPDWSMGSWLFSSPKVLKRGPCAKGWSVLVSRILLIVRVVLPDSRNAKLLKRQYDVAPSTYDKG